MSKLATSGKKFKCPECNNEIVVADGLSAGDFFECEFCGIEYEVVTVTEAGEYEVKIVEEEK